MLLTRLWVPSPEPINHLGELPRPLHIEQVGDRRTMYIDLLPVVRPLGVNRHLVAVLEPDQQVDVRAALDAHYAGLLTTVRVVEMSDRYIHQRAYHSRGRTSLGLITELHATP